MGTTLRWALLAVSLVVGVAALLRMAGPATAGPDPVSGAIRLPMPVTATIVTLFAIAGLVFMVALVRRMRSRRPEGDEELFGTDRRPIPPWMRTVTQVLSLLNVLLIAYLVWRGVIPLADLMALGAGAGGQAAMPDSPPLDAPLLVTWTFGALALAAGLAALGLALWVAFGDRVAEWWEQRMGGPPEPSRGEPPAPESLDAVLAESDPRRAILRCYGTFERLSAGSGVERKASHTPAEFMHEALARLTLPRGALPTLTGLFELARFSRRELGRGDRDRAVDALGDIRAAMARPEADVGTG